MLFHTVGQSHVFLSMLYAGLAIGAWYDLLAFVRHVLVAGKWLTAILDAVFGVGLFAILVLSMLMVNYGEMRLFCLLGACCGVVLYVFTLRALLRQVVIRPGKFLGRHIVEFFRMPWAKKMFR